MIQCAEMRSRVAAMVSDLSWRVVVSFIRPGNAGGRAYLGVILCFRYINLRYF